MVDFDEKYLQGSIQEDERLIKILDIMLKYNLALIVKPDVDTIRLADRLVRDRMWPQ